MLLQMFTSYYCFALDGVLSNHRKYNKHSMWISPARCHYQTTNVGKLSGFALVSVKREEVKKAVGLAQHVPHYMFLYMTVKCTYTIKH